MISSLLFIWPVIYLEIGVLISKYMTLFLKPFYPFEWLKLKNTDMAKFW